MNTIYTLSDPRTGEVRYVGKTSSRLSLRLWQHIRSPKNTHKDCWIRSLLGIGIKPVIEELESYQLTDAHKKAISDGFRRKKLLTISSTELATAPDGNSGKNQVKA